MKKITSKEPITLRLSGSVVLEIDSTGCVTDDSSAIRAVELLGGNITVTDISTKEVVAEAKKVLEETIVEDVVEEKKVVKGKNK